MYRWKDQGSCKPVSDQREEKDRAKQHISDVDLVVTPSVWYTEGVTDA
jgi:hypothetical protein